MSNRIDRRGFVKSGAIALVTTNYLGLRLEVPVAHSKEDVVDLLMKASLSHVVEINKRLQVISSEISGLRNVKVRKDLFTQEECDDVSKVISEKDALFAKMLADELNKVGVDMDVRKLEELVEAMTKGFGLKGKLTTEVRAAVAKFHVLIGEVKDSLIAKEIFRRIAREQSHATRLLEAIRTKNRVAIEEMLKRDVPGSNVDVREVKEDNGVFINLRIGKLAHCLSTSSRCASPAVTVTN